MTDPLDRLLDALDAFTTAETDAEIARVDALLARVLINVRALDLGGPEIERTSYTHAEAILMFVDLVDGGRLMRGETPEGRTKGEAMILSALVRLRSLASAKWPGAMQRARKMLADDDGGSGGRRQPA